MADFSKITANGTTYNVKDETARDDIATLKTRASSLEQETTTLTSNVSSHADAIEDLNTRLGVVEGGTISITYANETLTIG